VLIFIALLFIRLRVAMKNSIRAYVEIKNNINRVFVPSAICTNNSVKFYLFSFCSMIIYILLKKKKKKERKKKGKKRE